MKIKTHQLAGLLMLANLGAFAATAEEENRFLDAVRNAFAKRDKEAMMALSCWDRVSEEFKGFTPKALDYAFSRPVKTIQYKALDPAKAGLAFTRDGIAYGPNLPVIKQIEIEYEDVAGQPHMKSSMFVGEKDGKLMFVVPAPVPK